MTTSESIRRFCDDSLHPDSPSIWMAALVLLVALLLAWRLAAPFRRSRSQKALDRLQSRHRAAVRAYEMKAHEHDPRGGN